MTTLAQQILDAIDAGHTTAGAIMKHLGVTNNNVYAMLTQMISRRPPLVHRTKGAHGYEYSLPVVQEPVFAEVRSKPAAPPKPKTVDDALKALAAEITRLLMPVIETHVADAVKAAAVNAVEQATAHAATLVPGPAPTINAPQAEKVRKPHVLIAGLLPVQAGTLVAEFADTFDMSFWTSDETVHKLKSMAAGADVVFLHTRHMRHATDEIVQSAGIRIVRVTGALSAMREALTRYYVELTDK